VAPAPCPADGAVSAAFVGLRLRGLRRPRGNVRDAHYQRLPLHPLQPWLPPGGPQPSLRSASLAEAQQAGHRRARGAAWLVVPRLRRPSAPLDRPDSRPYGRSRAGWPAARSDERLLQGVQQPQALGADADPANATSTMTCDGRDGDDGRDRPCSAGDWGRHDPGGRTKSADLCGDQAARARMSGRLSLFLHKAGRGR